MECPVDEMDGEQTWPTEEEIEEAEIAAKSVKRVPKGWPTFLSRILQIYNFNRSY